MNAIIDNQEEYNKYLNDMLTRDALRGSKNESTNSQFDSMPSEEFTAFNRFAFVSLSLFNTPHFHSVFFVIENRGGGLLFIYLFILMHCFFFVLD